MASRFAYLDSPLPLALAHQGGDLEAPGNTIAAVEHTAQLGYRYLETDAHATVDGVVVLMHDETLDRTTDATGRISHLTWSQVARARDASGNPPLRLADVLTDFPHLRLNIDAKEDSVVRPLIRTVRAAGAVERVCLASFDDRRVRAIRRSLPGVATSLGRLEVVRLLTASKLPERAADRIAARTPALRSGGAACVQVPERQGSIRVVSPAFIATAHRAGLQVHVWTVNERDDMARLLDMGVDGIITDRPTELRDLLTERGVWAG